MPNLVKFATGTLAQFATLQNKDANTIYAITDAHQIFKGDQLLGMAVVKGDGFPDTGVNNTVYVDSNTGAAKLFANGAYTDLIVPTASAVADDTPGVNLVSVAALKAYVTKQIADMDVSAITDRIDAVETAVNTTLPKAIEDAQKAAQDYADKAVSDLTSTGAVKDLTDAVAALESGKADKATTLAGYGITDAYTKAETDSAITAAVANADHLKREIVTELPAVDDADTNTIYMVEKTDGSGDQQYDEFMLINGAFEKIGDSAVNLTGYATEAYVNDKVTEAKDAVIAAAATDATTKAGQALSDAKAYADGLAGNYATADQGTKADSALQKADVVSGSTNGTISVQGDDVAVKGLASAAYAETTDFDAAGSAATALSDAKDYVNQLLTWQTL